MTTQIMITLANIKSHDPCTSGWKKLLESKGGTKADYNKPFPVSDILVSNDLADTLWVLRCLPEHDKLWRKFAWWCATQVVHHTDDDSVQECLDVVERYCDGLANDDELKAAKAAAKAAANWAAADSADSAASSAAYWAANSAAYWAAYWAVNSVANSAAYLAADSAYLAAEYAQQAKLSYLLDTGSL